MLEAGSADEADWDRSEKWKKIEIAISEKVGRFNWSIRASIMLASKLGGLSILAHTTRRPSPDFKSRTLKLS